MTITETTTPPAVSAPPVLASLGARFGAICLDGVLILVAIFALSAVAGDASWGWIPVVAILALYQPLSLLAMNGQTVGKAAMHLRVVRPDGTRIGVGHACGRELAGRSLLGLVPFYGIADVITCLARGDNRALHDLIGGTIVVRADDEPELEPAAA
jgi:uncharacterized RDD family membrane protein YckC